MSLLKVINQKENCNFFGVGYNCVRPGARMSSVLKAVDVGLYPRAVYL